MTMPSPSYYDRQDSRCFNSEVRQKDAEQGSEALRLAMRQEFGKLALEHGISVRDARLLLQNGVQP